MDSAHVMRVPGEGVPRRAPPTAYDRIISGRLRSGITRTHTNKEQYPKRAPHFLPPLDSKSSLNSLTWWEYRADTPPHLTYLPEHLICPSCRRMIQTVTVSSMSRVTILLTACLCLMGCWLCVCLPSCLDSLKTVKHSCPRCKVVIGVYDPDIWSSVFVGQLWIWNSRPKRCSRNEKWKSSITAFDKVNPKVEKLLFVDKRINLDQIFKFADSQTNRQLALFSCSLLVVYEWSNIWVSPNFYTIVT